MGRRRLMTRLFELRKERGLSQRDVADRVQREPKHVQQLGRTPAPSLPSSSSSRLARFFEVSVDYLVGNSDDAGTINYITTLSPDEKRFIDTYASLSPALSKPPSPPCCTPSPTTKTDLPAGELFPHTPLRGCYTLALPYFFYNIKAPKAAGETAAFGALLYIKVRGRGA